MLDWVKCEVMKGASRTDPAERQARIELGRRVRARREELKLSQGELARRSGYSQTAISAIERGATKAPQEIFQLAEALGLSAESLLGRERVTLRENTPAMPTAEAQRQNGNIVDPHSPVSVGDYVIVEMSPTPSERAGPAYLKRLVRRTAAELVLEQFNPAMEIRLDAGLVKAIHRVLSWNDVIGR